MKKTPSYVDQIILDWILDDAMSQDDFDERLDNVSVYFKSVYEGVDDYYSGIE